MSSRLVDAMIEPLAYGVQFRRQAETETPDYETIREGIMHRLQIASSAVPGGADKREMDDATFAACAWWDEMVLSTGWPHKARWRTDPLQRHFYGTTDAGQRFFERLENLQPHQKNVREVFYLCLALGFRGRYCRPDSSAAYAALKADQLKRLFGDAAEVPSLVSAEKSRLSPGAYPESSDSKRPRQSVQTPWPNSLLVAGPMVTVAFLFFIYRFTLHSMGLNVLKVIR